MLTRTGRTTTLTLMVVTALAQGPVQMTTDSSTSATSSTTSTATTSIIVSPTSTVNTQTSATEVRYHTVKAGAGGFHFEPAELTNVSVGDVVTFEFYPPDHSVARAEFGSACVPYEYTGKDRIGFWSGTQWVKTHNDITHWNLTINSTEPIFYYCAAPDSCKGKQMIGVINPNATQTLHDQQLAAARADYQLAPGDPVPNEASSTFVSSPTASSQAELVSVNKPSPKLSTAAIAGITVGVVVFLTLCAGLLFFLIRKARVGHQTPVILHGQTGKQVNEVPVELGGAPVQSPVYRSVQNNPSPPKL
ncbi:hypothetical protein J3E72DRAFT_204375 [Bipolaris maydis]|nr:hypothetical protein J3E74DRAFT_230115 [Bipolaris maydis]KAJ5052531.1 hypothetical protein J3E74DRAFT_229237 [Bipolaris maydis]KAJ6192214.1 hypothetical protein J3E72DRAFT_204375 [Bipolaris maydis]